MRSTLIGDSMDGLYRHLVAAARNHGQPRRPRGAECLELRPGLFTLTRADLGLYARPSRRLCYRFWAAEVLSYIAGWGGPEHARLITALAPAAAQFVNERTGAFDGAYGPRMAHGLQAAISALRVDRDTRQAAVSIWDPRTLDAFRGSRDTPCTLSLQMYADRAPDGRSDTLAMTAVMRSNDLNWGTPYDAASFCAIQCLAADLVGLAPGEYHHVAGSLHLYVGREPDVSGGPPVPGIRIPRLRPDPRAQWPEGEAARTWWPDATPCVSDVPAQAGHFLMHMLEHLDRREPWEDFTSSLEAPGDGDNRYCWYWQQWAALVRFTWKTVL